MNDCYNYIIFIDLLDSYSQKVLFYSRYNDKQSSSNNNDKQSSSDKNDKQSSDKVIYSGVMKQL